MNRIVADRIREARSLAGISQKELSLLIGISDKAVSTYENGRTLPPLDILLKISEILKKPINFFVSEDDEDIRIMSKIESTEVMLGNIYATLNEVKSYLLEKKYSKLVPPNTPV